MLKKCYSAWNEQGKSVEIIYGSLDDDHEEFSQYYSQMPWLAYPIHDKSLKALKEKLNIESVPSLAVFKKGRFITKEGRSDLLEHGEQAIEKWQ